MLSLNDSKIGGVVRVCGSWLRRSLAAGLMLMPPFAHPQISSLDKDPHDQPFSYPSQPNDEIGGMAGRPLMPQNGALVSPPSVETVMSRWRAQPGAPELRYAAAVRDDKVEYRRRFESLFPVGNFDRGEAESTIESARVVP
jgi:hypothetical protein